MVEDKGFIFEGGNSVAVDREKTKDGDWDRKKWTTKAEAEKMDMSRLQRNKFNKEVINAFSILNKEVEKFGGEPLWNNFNVVKSGLAFNGSSNAMFDENISDADFLKHKPKVGDIDITVPRNRMIDLFKVLLKFEDKKFGNVEYIGNNRQKPSEHQQINAVFKYEVPGSDYVAMAQVDFEPSDYEDDKPTEWDSFSHSSDWADIQKGFKGVTHKYALTIMAHIVSKDFKELPGIMLANGADKKKFYTITPNNASKIASVTSKELGGTTFKDESDLADAMKKSGATKSAPKNILKKSASVPVTASHYLAFSVGKGLRVKYSSLLTKDNKPIMLDGKMVLIALDSKTSKSEKNLIPMFKLFFGYDPKPTDLKKMKSFVGVIELLKKSKLPDRKKDYEQFLDELIDEKLWGRSKGRAQELEKDSKEIDAEIKWSMVNYIMDELKVGNLTKIKKIAQEYYDTWEGGAGDDIREVLTIRPGKLSNLFEQVESIMESIIEPRGWKHFDNKRLAEEKIKILKKFDISDSEIINFMNSMLNSGYVNDVIRKVKPKRGLEDFLRYNPQEKTVSQQMIDRMLKRGY